MTTPASRGYRLPTVLRRVRLGVLWMIAVVVVGATAASMYESYDGLYHWGLEHLFPLGFDAAIAPLGVDAFIVIGEAILFVLVLDHRKVRWMWMAIVMSAIGLVLSFIGNVWRLVNADWAAKLTHGIYPIAAAAGLATSMLLLHLIVGDYHVATGDAAAPVAAEPAAGAPAAEAAPELPLIVPEKPAKADEPPVRPPARKPAQPRKPAGRGRQGVPPSERQMTAARTWALAQPKLPSERTLAAEQLGGNRRAAKKVLESILAERVSPIDRSRYG